MLLHLLPVSALLLSKVLADNITCSHHFAPIRMHYPVCNGPPQVYVVEPSHGRGLGVFAVHDLDIGDIVMRETPIIKISLSEVVKGGGYPMDVVSKLVHDEFNMLSSSAQEEVLALTYYTTPGENTPPDTLGNIFRTNAYNTGDKVGLFPRIARINHSCRPNTSYYWNEKLNKRIVYATRKIKAGEELFVSYISLLLSREDRQKQLDRYGFKCQCEACAQERAAQETSDRLRITIQRAFANFDHQLVLTPPQSAAEAERVRKNAEASVQLAQLVQTEGLADYYARAYRIAAISLARQEEWESASIWANKGYEMMYIEDPDSPATGEMQQLTTLFLSNWNMQLTGRPGLEVL
ncbi:uncharacterized protein yc1106_02713 [Curvularia clavata]|uniref:SET domain-containing protein n=1 Tax=Curvularia clavata TaxID=95742 RepID=A0A9Q8Z5V9_CURCL|nr:uncharacterized protein yc1106_02713 [Curvularia clavata]